MNLPLALLVVLAAFAFALFAAPAGTLARIAERVRSPTQREVGWLIVVLLVWGSRFELPMVERYDLGLDNSWRQGLGKALLAGMRFGVDIVFNHGPLGWFRESTPEPALLGWKIAHECVLDLVLAIIALLPLRWIRGTLWRPLYVFSVVATAGGPDVAAFQSIAAAAFWMVRSERTTPVISPSRVVVFLAISLLALEKFTYFSLASVCFVIVIGEAAVSRSLRSAAALASLASLSLLIAWWIAGQSVFDLPAYVVNSIAVATGYNAAMVRYEGPEPSRCALWIFGLVAALLALGAYARRREDPGRVACPVLAVAILFVVFKAGFVREAGATVLFFSTAFQVSLLLLRDGTAERTKPVVVRLESIFTGACCVLAIAGTGLAFGTAGDGLQIMLSGVGVRLTNGLPSLFDLDARKAAGAERLEGLVEQYRLPLISSIVGDSTVDAFDDLTSFVFYNQFQWRPRPVFQNYCAHGERLLELNRDFYASDRAPRFVLFAPRGMDARLPGSDDTLALQEILRRYDAVRTEREYVLMERSASPAVAVARKVVFDRSLRFGESIPLTELMAGGKCHVMKLEFERTPAGTLKQTFYKIDLPRLEITDSGGARDDYTIVPVVAAAGVLIDPLLFNDFGRMRFFGGVAPLRPTELCVLPPEHDWDAYVDAVHVTIETADDLEPRAKQRFVDAFRYSMFRAQPSEVSPATGVTGCRVDGREAMSVPPRSGIVFRLTPGKYVASGRFGMLDESWKGGESDGMVFGAQIHGPSQRVAFVRKLDPRAVASDRGTQRFEFEFEVAVGESIVFETHPGPKDDARWDFAWWSEIGFERAREPASDERPEGANQR